jgi:uncharacterized membrane protein (UPF0127 family)
MMRSTGKHPFSQPLLWLLLALLPLWAHADDSQSLDRLFPRSSLEIATPDARVHRFQIWVADTDPRRMRGLMFVKSMRDDQGMLFIYPSAQPISMWMKNTFIPLDMVFIGADGRITHIAANTVPHSLDTVASNGPAKAVLELNAGVAARLKLAPGALILHEAFRSR